MNGVSGVYHMPYGSSKKHTSKKKQKSKVSKQTQKEHEKFLKKVGALNPRPGRAPFPNNSVEDRGPAPTSGEIAGTGHKTKPYGNNESKETLEEIARKKERVAPLYNKGGLQYITDGTDLTSLGKKTGEN